MVLTQKNGVRSDTWGNPIVISIFGAKLFAGFFFRAFFPKVIKTNRCKILKLIFEKLMGEAKTIMIL